MATEKHDNRVRAVDDSAARSIAGSLSAIFFIASMAAGFIHSFDPAAIHSEFSQWALLLGAVVAGLVAATLA